MFGVSNPFTMLISPGITAPNAREAMSQRIAHICALTKEISGDNAGLEPIFDRL